MKTKKQSPKRKPLNAAKPPRSLAAASCSSDLAFLTLEAENMALTLESLGMGRHQGGEMCTPVERYRARFPRKTNAQVSQPETKPTTKADQ